jgi:hypothetical protein
MIRPGQIPDEVVEALRENILHDCSFERALAAALEAWPGAQFKMNGAMRTFLILPLLKDAADE